MAYSQTSLRRRCGSSTLRPDGADFCHALRGLAVTAGPETTRITAYLSLRQAGVPKPLGTARCGSRQPGPHCPAAPARARKHRLVSDLAPDMLVLNSVARDGRKDTAEVGLGRLRGTTQVGAAGLPVMSVPQSGTGPPTTCPATETTRCAPLRPNSSCGAYGRLAGPGSASPVAAPRPDRGPDVPMRTMLHRLHHIHRYGPLCSPGLWKVHWDAPSRGRRQTARGAEPGRHDTS